MTPEQFIERVLNARGLVPTRVPAYTKLSEFVTVGVDQVASPDTGEVWLAPRLLDVFDEARRIHGSPIPITAGSRTHRHEMALTAAGYKTAKFVSTHSLSALDLDARPKAGLSEQAVNIQIRTALVQAAAKMKLPRPRLGYKAYKEKFTHFDMVFLFFEPYTDLPHPTTWPDLSAEQRALIAGWQPGVEW